MGIELTYRIIANVCVIMNNNLPFWNNILVANDMFITYHYVSTEKTSIADIIGPVVVL